MLEKRRLAHTDMDLTVLSYGASSIGQEFRVSISTKRFEAFTSLWNAG